MRRLIISLVVVLLLTLATAGPAFAVAHGPNPLCDEDSAIANPDALFPHDIVDPIIAVMLDCPFQAGTD